MPGRRPRRLLSHRSRRRLAGTLVPLGVKTVQLRLKDAPPERVRREIAAELGDLRPPRLPADRQRLLARGLRARRRLFIWARRIWPAPTCGHPGKGCRLGISTHSQEELAIALAARPTYVALGPIYETKLKVMKWAPQGLQRITDWKAAIGAYLWWPLAASRRNGPTASSAAGADSVAVITDFFTHAKPTERVRERYSSWRAPTFLSRSKDEGGFWRWY